ncbi:hypothetical protein PoB_004530300 [Plakobranchus ocellatus]|uniref:Uncharacterized protein n=1 Tax=Plakobranchus ocellatus TaxID=259542 RepID=A0AAV4BHZ1_9GAST|nr:hypothetical protein PoB_004530300 [Plakobranchus ocellatus]
MRRMRMVVMMIMIGRMRTMIIHDSVKDIGFVYSTWLPVTLAILVVFVLLICVFIIRRSYRKQRQKIVQVLQLLEPIPPKEGDCAYSETCKRRRGSLPEPPLNALNSSQPCHAKQSATSSSDEKSANSNTPLIIADQYHMVTELQNTDEKSPFICENKQHSDGAQPQQSHDLKYKSSLTGRAESYQIMGVDIQSSDGSRTQGVNTTPKVSVDDRNSVGNQGSFSQNIMIVNATNGKGINHLGENISLHGDAQKTLTKNASLGQNLQQQSGNTLNNQKCSSTGDENITDFKPVSNLSDQVLSSAANGTQNDFDLAYSDMNMVVQGQLGSQSPRNNPPTTVSTSQCSSLANTSASDTLNPYTTIGISGQTPLATDLSFSQTVPSDGSPRNPSIILPDSECASDAGHCPSHSKEPHNLTPFIYPASAIPGGSSDILNDANQTSHPNFDISFPESIQYTKIAPCHTWSSDYVPHA